MSYSKLHTFVEQFPHRFMGFITQFLNELSILIKRHFLKQRFQRFINLLSFIQKNQKNGVKVALHINSKTNNL